METPETHLRERLLADAEARIDQLLSNGLEARLQRGAVKLSEIEQLIVQSQREFGQTLTETLLVKASEATVSRPVCPDCGRVMRAKGRKRRQVVTSSGQGQIERDYYYCPACRRGHFPPG